MNTPRTTRGAPPSRTIHTDGVDPLVVQLRTEQVRQGLSDYALGLATGLSPQKLGTMWRGTVPTLTTLRKVLEALRKGSPAFDPKL